MEDFTKRLLETQQKSFNLMTEMRAKLRRAKTVEDIRHIQAEFKAENAKLWNEYNKLRS